MPAATATAATTTPLSEHALANALDVSEFVFASPARRSRVLASWPRVATTPPTPEPNPVRVARRRGIRHRADRACAVTPRRPIEDRASDPTHDAKRHAPKIESASPCTMRSRTTNPIRRSRATASVSLKAPSRRLPPRRSRAARRQRRSRRNRRRAQGPIRQGVHDDACRLRHGARAGRQRGAQEPFPSRHEGAAEDGLLRIGLPKWQTMSAERRWQLCERGVVACRNLRSASSGEREVASPKDKTSLVADRAGEARRQQTAGRRNAIGISRRRGCGGTGAPTGRGGWCARRRSPPTI